MLWPSAPPATLMRLNASIAKLLLTGLLLSSAPLLAKTARHVVRKTASESATKKHASVTKHAPEKTSEIAAKPHKKRRRTKPRQVDAPEPVTVSRVHATSHQRTSTLNHTIAAKRDNDETAPASAPRKATSEDFIRAASGTAPEPGNPTGISQPPDDDEQTPRSTPPVKRAVTTREQVPAQAKQDTQKLSREIIAEDTEAPIIQPTLYNKRGRLIVPKPLKGSHDILVRQNVVADREGLDRIKDDDDLEDMREHRLLVSLPLSPALEVDEKLPANRRYCRPWTAQFLAALARAHYARFHTPLQVNSAVRTVEFQQRLQRTNGNAAPAEGETASPHLTGQAIDLAKHGLSLTEIAWMRGYLLPLVQQGKIDVEEEFQQSCFHISVYKRYLPASETPKREIAGNHSATATLATAMP